MVTEEETQEWIQIAEAVWHCMDGTCLPQHQEVASNFGEEILLWDDHVAEIFDELDYRYLGEEMVNGLRAFHYVILSPPARSVWTVARGCFWRTN